MLEGVYIGNSMRGGIRDIAGVHLLKWVCCRAKHQAADATMLYKIQILQHKFAICSTLTYCTRLMKIDVYAYVTKG